MRIRSSLLVMLMSYILIFILFNTLFNTAFWERDISILLNRVAIISLCYCFLFTTTCIFIITKDIGLHGGLLNITNIALIFQMFIFFTCIIILQLTSFYSWKFWIEKNSTWKDLSFFLKNKNKNKNKNNKYYLNTNIISIMGEQFKIMEYSLIILFVIDGAIFLISTRDLVSLFLSLEMQSFGLYLLSTVFRNSELSTTGGLMYFLLGGLSSCFILLACSLLYANSGTTSLDGLYIINSISNITEISTLLATYGQTAIWYKSYYISFSLLILSLGLLFKVSAAPFHFWSPDVYDSIPTIVTTFVAIIAKISIFVFLLGLVYYTGSPVYSLKGGVTYSSWTLALLISSLLSLLIGTVGGLSQFRIKRLFAYSTITHVGFILLALCISNIESIQAFIFYLMQYSISNLNAFIILITLGFILSSYLRSSSKSSENKDLFDKKNSPIQLISQLRGFFFINPLLALSLTITIFSFAGTPPLVGFFAKQMVLSAALNNGYIFFSLIAILTSVIGAVYYLNIIKEIFFFSSEYKRNPKLKIYNVKGTIYNELKEKVFFTLFLKKYLSINYVYPHPLAGKLLAFIPSGIFYARDSKTISSIGFNYSNLIISSSIALTISIITIIIFLYLFMNKQWLSMCTLMVHFFCCP